MQYSPPPRYASTATPWVEVQRRPRSIVLFAAWLACVGCSSQQPSDQVAPAPAVAAPSNDSTSGTQSSEVVDRDPGPEAPVLSNGTTSHMSDDEILAAIQTALDAARVARNERDRQAFETALSAAHAAFMEFRQDIDSRSAPMLDQQMDLAWRLGSLHVRIDAGKAAGIFQLGIDAGRRLLSGETPDAQPVETQVAARYSRLAGMLHNLAMLTRSIEDRVAPYREAIVWQAKSLEIDASDSVVRKHLSNHYRALAEALHELDRSDEVLPLLAEDLQLWSTESQEYSRTVDRIRAVATDVREAGDPVLAKKLEQLCES